VFINIKEDSVGKTLENIQFWHFLPFLERKRENGKKNENELEKTTKANNITMFCL